ncbi:MAG: MATE family efflux transporter [Clostridiales bacterium]|nr:MATE family efflux transporter [Clostridiales bacterium]
MPISEKAAFRKKLISLILPMTLQNFMFSLVPLSDTIMLVSDQDAMSAVSLASQVAFVFSMFSMAISSGCSMFAAQFWGKGDKQSIERLFGYCIRLLLPILVLFFGCTMFMPEAVMRIYTNEPTLIAHGIPYLRIASFSYVCMGLSIVYESILKNVGLVKQCTFASGVMVILNVCLNAVFIYGLFGVPKMGATGAAIATTISAFAGLLFCIYFSLTKKIVSLRLKYVLKTGIKLRQRFSKYSAPFFLNQIIWSIGFTMITVIMGHLGNDAVAANAIVTVIKDIVSSFCYALGAGGAIVVGNELGAGRLETAKDYGRRIMKLCVVSGILLGLLAASTAPLVIRFVNLTPRAEHFLFIMILMCSYYILGRSINCTTIGGIFSAGGDTKFGFICDTVTMWAFIIPIGCIAAFVLKLPVLVVYFLLNLDEIVKLPVVIARYRQFKWVRNIVNDMETDEV